MYTLPFRQSWEGGLSPQTHCIKNPAPLIPKGQMTLASAIGHIQSQDRTTTVGTCTLPLPLRFTCLTLHAPSIGSPGLVQLPTAFCNQLGTPGGPVLLHPPEQWFPILLMLQPFTTVPHVVLKPPSPVTHTIKSFSLLLCNCNFGTGMNWNVNSFGGWGFAKGVRTHRLRTTRGLPPSP